MTPLKEFRKLRASGKEWCQLLMAELPALSRSKHSIGDLDLAALQMLNLEQSWRWYSAT